ncbi:hypothetical protein ABN242_17605 [Providencia alcalifaciens]|uniref:hypothetical protein n=1 Tax=Providencia TaxID=586 RepID=UPI0023498309|nr:hypothetical protein [Providencia sp. PROV033]
MNIKTILGFLILISFSSHGLSYKTVIKNSVIYPNSYTNKDDNIGIPSLGISITPEKKNFNDGMLSVRDAQTNRQLLNERQENFFLNENKGDNNPSTGIKITIPLF